MEPFDGNKIRDQILLKIRKEIVENSRDIGLAVILAGDNPVCEKYVELKKGIAEKLGVNFDLYKFEKTDKEDDISETIKYLNTDPEVDGIMIQIPVDQKFNRDTLISLISPQKDIDGLRFCLDLASDFRPPVVLAVLEAMKSSGKDLKKSRIVIVGRGFLVGDPLRRALLEMGVKAEVADSSTKDLKKLTETADILVTAVGRTNIITEDMIKEGVALIDAGTTEQNGTQKGDIAMECYHKASFYTPVPGGIGPVTIAMLFQNLLKKTK